MGDRKDPGKELADAFGLGQAPGDKGLVCIVGGGGKTSLMFALSAALPGRVILTTTTRIFAAQMKLADAVCYADDLGDLDDLLAAHGRVLVVGQVEGEKAFGVPLDLPAGLLARGDVDAVLVEADGSRMRPIKAPAAHEPVIPAEANLVIPVVGIDALGEPVATAAHRPQRVQALVGEWLSPDEARLTPEAIARLIIHSQGGMKDVPDTARVIPLINKVETDAQQAAARRIAQMILRLVPEPARLPQVVLGAVKSERPMREIQRPVTAVVLAAGQSTRMGQTKQLLPWAETTVLGQTVQNVKASGVQAVWVVTGHEAEQVTAVAQAAGVHTLHNPDYATGEMLSSLQTAVRQLPPWVTAVVVMLADQPMVPSTVIDQLLAAYGQGVGDLIAPVFGGQRGNPVLIGRRHFEALLALPPGEAPRTLLRQRAADLVLLPVETEAILQDLDEREQYERLRP